MDYNIISTFPYKNMVGTWCSVELKEALRLGYEIEEVFEAIVWDKQSRGLFTDFLKFGIMNKIYSSKVGEEEYDEFVKENAIGELPFPEIGQDWKLPTDNTFHFKCKLDKNKFRPDKSRRQMFKLIINSFYGHKVTAHLKHLKNINISGIMENSFFVDYILKS